LTYESSKTAHQIERLVFGLDRFHGD
jgi:hypothetical protein